MIYLILDTNTWLYLANNNDPLTGVSHEDLHIKLFDKLAQKVKDGSIKILINEIIEKEWLRNKSHTQDYITKLNNILVNDLKVIDSIKNAITGKLDVEIEKIKKEYQEKIYARIAENQVHISNVEQLLDSSNKYDISIETRAFATDWALDKKAPFVGQKSNSMADALILFSAIEQIQKLSTFELFDEPYIDLPTSIFISGNSNDFSSKQNPNQIHEDLKPLLDSVKMDFFRTLPLALNFVDNTLFEESEMERIESEMQMLYDSHVYSCLACNPDEKYQSLAVVHFSRPFQIINETIKTEDPNQLVLDLKFDIPINIPKQKIIDTIQWGVCSFCNTDHIKCQNCGEIKALTDDVGEIFKCEGCGLTYKIESEQPNITMSESSIRIISEKIDDEDLDAND